MLKRIQSRVNDLASEASCVFIIKDRMFDVLLDVDNKLHQGRMTKDQTIECYRLARELNDLYRAWNSSAWPIVQANLPERTSEFEALYEVGAKSAVDIMNPEGYLSRESMVIFEKCLSGQVGFVRSIPGANESKALGLRGILARDLMEDELAAARHLLSNGYVREAGVIGGVVLEGHLRLMCQKRSIALAGKETLGDLNAKLRTLYPDDSEFRRVQFLNEIRIQCAHNKGAIPDQSKVEQFLSGVQQFIVTIS